MCASDVFLFKSARQDHGSRNQDIQVLSLQYRQSLAGPNRPRSNEYLAYASRGLPVEAQSKIPIQNQVLSRF